MVSILSSFSEFAHHLMSSRVTSFQFRSNNFRFICDLEAKHDPWPQSAQKVWGCDQSQYPGYTSVIFMTVYWLFSSTLEGLSLKTLAKGFFASPDRLT